MGVGITCPNCRNVFAFFCGECASFETEMHKSLELAQYFQSRGQFYFKCRRCLAEFAHAVCPECGTRVIPEEPFVTGDKGSAGPSRWCFIATACIGERPDILEPLYMFRDELLARSRPGRKLIAVYYTWGPPAAGYISQRRLFRMLAKYLLVYPAFYAATALMKVSSLLKKK